MIVWYDDLQSEAEQRAAIKSALPPDLHSQKHGRNKKYWFCGSGFDCETTKTPKGFTYVYLWQFSLHNTDFHGRTISSFERFAEQLDDILTAQYRKISHGKIKSYPQLLIYDANFGYEYAQFKCAFDRIGIREVFGKDTRHPLFINLRNCLEFREALGVWGYSLENIGELWTETKKAVGELRYDLPRHSGTPITAAEQVYTSNDVRILSELGIIALKMYEGRRIPITGTGIIRQATKDRIMGAGRYSLDFEKEKVHRVMPRSHEDYNIVMDLLYCGGLTHSNVRLARQVHENALCADLVSDFPAQMTHENFPSGSLIGNRNYDEMIAHKHWYARITFYNLKSKTGHSIISQHKCVELYHPTIDNGRIYAAEVCSVYCTEIDFQNIGLIYTCGEIEFDDMHYFSQSRPCPPALLSVMWEKYEKKASIKPKKKAAEKKLKAAENEGNAELIEQALKELQPIKKEYEGAKKFVNGCYGMTSTRIYTTEIRYGQTESMKFPALYEDQRRDKDDNHILGYSELIKDLWLSPWIAIYTTAYARRILCRLINKYPDIIIQYDTDSIYFLDGREGSEELKSDIEKYNEEMRRKNDEKFGGNPLFSDLGTWEYDPPIDKIKVLGAKRYLKQSGNHIQLVCAGCKPQAFNEYCEQHNVDPFAFFDKNMRLPPDESKKTTLRYFPQRDKAYVDTITDYLGNTQKVEIETCATITEVPFNLWVSRMWIDFIKEKQKQL